jgi:hypothetical protein
MEPTAGAQAYFLAQRGGQGLSSSCRRELQGQEFLWSTHLNSRNIHVHAVASVLFVNTGREGGESGVLKAPSLAVSRAENRFKSIPHYTPVSSMTWRHCETIQREATQNVRMCRCPLTS